MVSFLDDTLAQEIADGLGAELQTGTLRQLAESETLDAHGDPISATPATYDFKGFRDNFSAYARANGIPDTDCKINILAKTCTATPQRDDKALLDGQWYHLSKLHELDPAGALYVFQAHEIETPT